MITVLARRGADAIIADNLGNICGLTVWWIGEDRDREFWACFALPLQEDYFLYQTHRWPEAQLECCASFINIPGRPGRWMVRDGGNGYIPEHHVTLLAQCGADLLMGAGGVVAQASLQPLGYGLVAWPEDSVVHDSPLPREVRTLNPLPPFIYEQHTTTRVEYSNTTFSTHYAQQVAWPYPVQVLWDGRQWHTYNWRQEVVNAYNAYQISRNERGR